MQLLESLMANDCRSITNLNLEWSANFNSEEACVALAKFVAQNLQLSKLNIGY